ncbi:uncharacterized protein [Aegilops tauschii subsp. strangulata]|uniref:uncharacterized protein n=1 Tax=Aegilops tauschii subsp. strangulata TaxID=200361 RepID=UPI003CC88E6A
MTLNRVMEIATRYANGEEEDRLRHGKGRTIDHDAGSGNPSRKQKRKAKATGQAEAEVTCQVYLGDWLSTVCVLTPKPTPVKEHLRRSAAEKRKAIGEEVARLLAAEFIREIYHSKLLANIVMVPKKDNSLFVSDAPLSEIMKNPDATGRVAKWAIELLPLDIKFEAKKAIKSQALADLLAEWIEQQKPTQVHSEHWTMFFDGSKMSNGSGVEVILVSPRGDKLSYVLRIHFDSSNNEAEYEALLYGLRMAISLSVRPLMVYGNSDLVVNQVMKEWDVKNPAMTGYCNSLRKLEKSSKRSKSQQLSTSYGNPSNHPDWTVPYTAYLLRQELPEDEVEAHNGSNFDSEEFREYCASQGTRVDYASVTHPQSNGQVERANGLILQGLKPRLMRDLEHAAGAWVTKVSSVLWGLRTTPKRSTNRTPFFMVYGTEVVLPSDLFHNAPRVELYSEAEAEQAHQDAVDLLEEEREMALIRSTIYQQDHARNVKGRAFQEGDLVLRVDQQRPHKLALMWEGPFLITKVLHNGAYHLYNFAKKIDEPCAWNVDLLRRFYT